MPQPPTPMPPGARLVSAMFDRVPGLRVASMTPERLSRMQGRALPERGIAGALVDLGIGRKRRGVRLERRTTASGLPLRLHLPTTRPGAPRPAVVLALHGGGFVVGSARQSDWTASRVAADLPAVVVAPDYRLAPRHPFPAAVDDCLEALDWAHRHADALGADPHRLGVLGESAGGNLAAVTCLAAAASGGPRIAHQVLICPATDLTEAVGETASFVEHEHAGVLSGDSLRFFRETYLGADGDADDWRFSPVRAASHAGQPPTLVVLAGHDPLRDTGAAYADRLAADGVPVRVVEFRAMPHGFVGFPYLARDAGAALRAVVADQRAHLSSTREEGSDLGEGDHGADDARQRAEEQPPRQR